MSALPVRPPRPRPAAAQPAVQPWDPRAPEVAAELAREIGAALPGTEPEHVGSSAVPGMPGSNVVDLAIEAEPADIPRLAAGLRALGFAPADADRPAPPTRPLLTGEVARAEGGVPVRVRVVPPGRGALAEMRAFRDALGADEGLREAYAAAKADPARSDATAAFVEDALHRLGIRGGPRPEPVPLAPGATVGVLGGGQLGRMLGTAARAMGYRLVVLDPDPACPSAAVADEVIVARYDDAEAARRLASLSDVVTYELEHVGADAARAASEIVPLRPGLEALRVTQDRLAERRFIESIGEWAAPWREVRGPGETRAAADELGYPVRIKLPLGGYDGRSQVRVPAPEAVAAAVTSLGGDDGRPLLLEREIPFRSELSVVCARGRDGRTVAFPVSGNRHDAGILVESVAPAPLDPAVVREAAGIAGTIARAVDLVGVLTAELFLLPDGGVMINELAPRVHNSGHWSIEGAATSQFEQHLRAILGLPLGSVSAHGVTAMVNLLGTGAEREARLAGLADALADPGAHVHVYGKRRVFERRKMGHVTVVGRDAGEALARAWRARDALRWED